MNPAFISFGIAPCVALLYFILFGHRSSRRTSEWHKYRW